MRPLVGVLVLAVALAGCSGDGAASPQQDALSRGEALRQLREDVDAVTDDHEEADRRLGEALAAVREMDAITDALRSPETIDEARDRWPRADGAFRSADVDGLREALFAVARSVDRARATLVLARRHAADPWEEQYLDAQDRLLVTLRDYAEAADGLARALVTYWPVYEVLHGETARFVEQRWFYRSSQEAADAYELAVADHLDELATARRDIRRQLEERDAAATDVEDARGRLRELDERRPTAPASPGFTGGPEGG